MTTIQTYRHHRDGLVAVVKTTEFTVSVWDDGTCTRLAVVNGREDGPEEDITSETLASEVTLATLAWKQEAYRDALELQKRAVAYGAADVCPTIGVGGITWPANIDAVSFKMLWYTPSDDMFSAWDGGNVPLWEQH